MPQLLWAILNFGILVYFIYICFEAAKLIAMRFGIFAAIIFVLGVMGGNCGHSKATITNTLGKIWQINTDAGIINQNLSKNAKVTGNLMFSVFLGVKYGTRTDSNMPVPIEAYTTVSGTFIGIEWTTEHMAISPTSDPWKYSYDVNGTTEWKMFGAVIFTNSKNYTGFLTLK